MPISDVLFLEGNDPEEIIYSDDPYSYGKWFCAKNIETIALSKLGEFLGVASYEELSSGFNPIHPPEGEAFILSIPEKLQDKIRVLSEAEIDAVVKPWSLIEEFGEGAEADAFRKYLTGLREFLNQNEGYANLFLAI